MLLTSVNSNAVCGSNSSAIQCRAMKLRRKLDAEQEADARRLKALWEARFSGVISQEEVAHRCGWKTQGAFNQYLNGKIPLNLAALLKISVALGVEPHEISPALASQLSYSAAKATPPRAEPLPGPRTNPPIDAGLLSLMSKASPRSYQQLIKIAEASADGRLSEDDVALLHQIAERIAKKE